MTTPATPTTYLSVSDGKYRVIHQGMPVCADKATRQEAIRAATYFKLTLPATFWNGDAGTWEVSK